jgi:hypothetical protein
MCVGERIVSIASRLRQVRGSTSRNEFGAKLSVHLNTVGNYEGDREAPVSYITAVAKAYGIRLEWLIYGTGSMREGEEEPTFFQEKIAYWVSLAIERRYGANLNETSLDTRAKILRAVSKYLITMGVTEQSIPDQASLVGMVTLTAGLLGAATAPSQQVRRNKKSSA